ncbi:MAG: efflux RND transporter periplasmic adaptor subunit [Muricauda sp.]|nr:efflux RND transporter periplasmic adaptor subunit [Allomuricauda sp.]MBO6531680.1 efflux RND transporter periplasmic adaptor subunit [Allomuricauda sp.]MBO6588193.1 efflux RND transporter periplasmic adaptor subunit [Allomuricauda sp.]MBO6617818.1 efflux RND transporter periplasmic adaptor subunit [Allomuricauda sp.]MBO6643171.1 efflux RND transporter periplasmic adaptor subunit [Allomuricauda sp.]MBO6746153.1 efflux RND transporter periplasmic adaptor subunit [Allomuricauda sp.]
MKKAIYITITTLVLASCGSGSGNSVESVIASKDVEAIRAKRNSVTEELKALESQVKQLDEAIGELEDNTKLPLVSALTVEPQQFQHYLELQGDVMTDQNVLVYPEMAGTLYRVYVKEGQRVSKGQLLASIDDGGLSSQLAQLRTQAELAKTTFERQKRLWEQNIGSEIQYLQAKTQYEAQQSAVKQLESQVGKSSIRAPFSGIVDDIIKDQGTVVSPGPGSEIFRIVNLSDMYIDVEVPESHLPNVTPGKEAEVYFPVLGESITTQVRQTGNFINPSNRSFSAEIPVPNKNGKVKPNLTAKVKINDYTNENAILIPQSVVSENAEGEQYVYLIAEENGEVMAKKSIITPGRTQGDYLEVLEGISSGSQVIVEGARRVRDGQKVQVIDSTTTAKN